MTQEFLLFSLFFPRITLAYCFVSHVQAPPEPNPAFSLIAGLFVPRLLIAFWIMSEQSITFFGLDKMVVVGIFLVAQFLELYSSKARIGVTKKHS